MLAPKLKSLLARATLVGGVALLATTLSRSLPHDQTIAIRLVGHDVQRLQGLVTAVGDDEATAGFSRDFPNASPGIVRHKLSAANGTYIVVISLTERAPTVPDQPTDGVRVASPKLTETSFERRVSLAGGEVIVSPD